VVAAAAATTGGDTSLAQAVKSAEVVASRLPNPGFAFGIDRKARL